MAKETIKIDIVSDVACPWCYVGKRRLEEAIKQWEGSPIEIDWHPFQLDPTLPVDGIDRTTYLKNKFGSMDQVNLILDRLTDAGKEVDIKFDFDSQNLSINTLPMHQLLYVAGLEGFKNELKERFLKAYFQENVTLHKVETLCEIMSEYNWDHKKTKDIIADDAIAFEVKKEIAHYKQSGVSGVPFFIINNKYGISGAQPSKVFLDAFESVSPIKTISEGPSCDPITGEC